MQTLKLLEYEQERNIVFFLGAGASYADGAPLQQEIVELFLGGTDEELTESYAAQLARDFLKSNFYLESGIPQLEAVFAYLDYFILNDESLSSQMPPSALVQVREALVQVIHHIIDRESSKCSTGRAANYRKFWQAVQHSSFNISVITTNYDTLLEEAFDFLFPRDALIDYCIHLMNYENTFSQSDIDPFNWWINPRQPVMVSAEMPPSPVKVIKLHGSLNWKYCKCCQQVLLTPWQSDIDLEHGSFFFDQVWESGSDKVEFRCPWDNSKFATLIVPPSHVKQLRNPFLTALREEAARELRITQRVVVVGYSFPDADVHLKALLAKNIRAQTELLVVDPYLNDRAKAAFRSIHRNVTFLDVTFEEALADENHCAAIFK